MPVFTVPQLATKIRETYSDRPQVQSLDDEKLVKEYLRIAPHYITLLTDQPRGVEVKEESLLGMTRRIAAGPRKRTVYKPEEQKKPFITPPEIVERGRRLRQIHFGPGRLAGPEDFPEKQPDLLKWLASPVGPSLAEKAAEKFPPPIPSEASLAKEAKTFLPRLAAGFVDFAQSPQGLAFFGTTAATGGTAALYWIPVFLAQLAYEGSKQAVEVAEDPSNPDKWQAALTTGAIGAMVASGGMKAAVKRGVAPALLSKPMRLRPRPAEAKVPAKPSVEAIPPPGIPRPAAERPLPAPEVALRVEPTPYKGYRPAWNAWASSNAIRRTRPS